MKLSLTPSHRRPKKYEMPKATMYTLKCATGTLSIEPTNWLQGEKKFLKPVLLREKRNKNTSEGRAGTVE